MRDESTGWTEADITINGKHLSFAESMALRVAVSSYLMFVCEPASAKDLGEDLAKGYARQLSSVQDALFWKHR
jgi:hypothetical protein